MKTPEEWMRDFEAKIAEAQAKAAAVQEGLAQAGGSASSKDGSIIVSVAPNGALTGLELTADAMRKAPGQLPSPPSCRNGRSCATGVLRLRSPEATSIARSSPKSLRVERGGTRTRREHIFGEPGQAKACPTRLAPADRSQRSSLTLGRALAESTIHKIVVVSIRYKEYPEDSRNSYRLRDTIHPIASLSQTGAG